MICELALILAIDVSGSVQPEHYELQRDATAQAMVQIMRPHPGTPMAVQVIMWGTDPHVVIPWRLLQTTADVHTVAQELTQVARPEHGFTNMSSLMEDALESFDHTPCEPERKIIDISGDGTDTERRAHFMRDRAREQEVQVNALAIETDIQDYDITEYFRSQVITPDGFVITARSWHDFSRAIRTKLAMEIAHVP